MNDYNLNKREAQQAKSKPLQTLKNILILLRPEKKRLLWAGGAVFTNSALNLAAPVIIGLSIDDLIATRQFSHIITYAWILLLIYCAALIANYYQTMLMGLVGQNMLFNLRNLLFTKIQSLPIAFFNQNKAGDLISRINNDTDKLNQFMSQGLVQFAANIITIGGAAIFIIIINWRLGLAALLPAAGLFVFTRLLSPWIKKTNARSLNKTGNLSAKISENLENFKIIIAFNRRDYFRQKFAEANTANYQSAISAGIANNTLNPVYGLASNFAQLIVLAYGLSLILMGNFTLGLLISYLSYVNRLYDPLRQMAQIWSSFQTALAGWDRINNILGLKTDLAVCDNQPINVANPPFLEFKQVYFQYNEGENILKNINLQLERGKTYALVGPTGGGKTTTASLMARLYDPTQGGVYLAGRDLRCYEPAQRVQKIGFILQDPFLFTGTLRENLLYGNELFSNTTDEELHNNIERSGLNLLLERFDQGLETLISGTAQDLSLGQKQLIAFMRAVLRKPELLILDEASANIDTLTEKLLEEILKNLPAQTTKIIIAHRLNTIANADEIFFVNDGEITNAGSMENALNLLLHHQRQS